MAEVDLGDYDELLLKKVADRFGVSTYYFDVWNKKREVPRDTLYEIILSMSQSHVGEINLKSILEEPNANEIEICNLISLLNEIPHFRIIFLNNPDKKIEWSILTEDSRYLEGYLRSEDIHEFGKKDSDKNIVLDVPIPIPMKYGYHSLVVRYGSREFQKMIIYAPPHCYVNDNIFNGGKAYGLNVQLYSLRSKENMGIGDFGDVRRLAEALEGSPIRILGFNPLLSLFPHDPWHVSPYSPSSRLFLNPMYLGISDMKEIVEDDKLSSYLNKIIADGGLLQIKGDIFVRYEDIWPLKEGLFFVSYQDFLERHLSKGTILGQEFELYRRKRKELLTNFSLFVALNRYFKQEMGLYSWNQWPKEYQDPKSANVTEWAQQHRNECEFYEYLFWLAERAFDNTRSYAKEKGMCFYLDLPVGVSGSGFETWYWNSFFSKGMSIGAPPDEFNPNGQDWGLPPLNPLVLRADFRPFIETIRFNMEKADILRIDHIMGLMRLFWVPEGKGPERGAYVLYPMDEMFSILCLESHRNKCMVIGEDLGTVPDEVRETMARKRIFSSSVLIFEKEGAKYKRPAQYKEFSVASITTHDLPTLRGFWELHDIITREKIGLFSSSETREKYIELRKSDKTELIAMLEAEGLIEDAIDKTEILVEFSDKINKAIHMCLIIAKSKIVMFQFEDIIGEIDQKNLPGTVTEYPNWRKKLPLDIEQLLKHDFFLWLLAEIRKRNSYS